MKTNAIVRIICYSLVALLLVGILVTGIGAGELGLRFNLGSSGEPITGEVSVDAAKVQNIEIQWVSGNIDIYIAADGREDLWFCESGADNEDDRGTWEIRGQTLVIRYDAASFTFGFTSTQDKDLTLVFPADWFCNDLDIETVSGSVDVTLLNAAQIDVESVSAQCSFVGCAADTVSLSTVSGTVSYKGEVDTLKCESVSADCEILPDNNPKELKLDSVSGDLIVGIFEDAGFTANLDSVSGKIYSDFSTSSVGGDQTYGDGSCQIKADTVSGDIEIRKMEYRLTDTCQHQWDSGTVTVIPGDNRQEMVYTCTLCSQTKGEVLSDQAVFMLSCADEFTESLLLNPLPGSYAAGYTITIQTEILTDVDLHLYVNGEFVCGQTEAFAQDGSNHWEFTFTMPTADTEIRLETHDGVQDTSTDNQRYMDAVSLAVEGKTAQAAIAFGQLGDYLDARERSTALWSQSRVDNTLLVTGALLAAIRDDGTIQFQTHLENPYPESSQWTDVRSLAAGQAHFVALQSDGTVLAAGDNTYGQCDVGSWKDIVSVDCGSWFTVGLRSDGTVLFAGQATLDCAEVIRWTDIAMLEAAGDTVLGLHMDGTVQTLGASLGEIPAYNDIIDIHLHGRCATVLRADGSIDVIGDAPYVEDQVIPGLVRVETDGYYLFGLMADGTPYYAGHGEITGKGHIVAVADYGNRYLGLRSDGTLVLISFYSESTLETPEWTDLMVPTQYALADPAYLEAQALLAQGRRAEAAIAFGKLGDYADARSLSIMLWRDLSPAETISAESPYIAAVRSDGTVITSGPIGQSDYPQRQAEEWTDIVSVSCGFSHILGIRKDGTVIAAGDNSQNQCDVSAWRDIVLIRAGDGFSLGLKADGTVVCVGAIPEGVADWTNVAALECADDHVIGLCFDGSVLAAGGDEWGECAVTDVENVIDIYTDEVRTTLLTVYGSIINRGQDDVFDIDHYPGLISYSVCAGCHYGTMADGTVVCLASNETVDPDSWQNSVAFVGYCGRLFGLQANGSLQILYEFSEAEGPTPDWAKLMIPAPEKYAPYLEAEALLASGKTVESAIAFAKLGDQLDARARSLELWHTLPNTHTIAKTMYHSFAVTKEGTVLCAGDTEYEYDGGQIVYAAITEAAQWTDIVAISGEGSHIIGLRSDGTVVTACDSEHTCTDVSSWTDIIAVAAGMNHFVGLKSDGTVVVAGNDTFRWDQVAAWTDIIAIDAGYRTTVGLRSDGTVIYVANDFANSSEMSDWRDIVSISTDGLNAIGLRADGTVVCTSDSGAVSLWSDVAAVYIDYKGPIARRTDGTFVYADNSQNFLNDWTGVIDFVEDGQGRLGLKADGTIIFNGINACGEGNVEDWDNVKMS